MICGQSRPRPAPPVKTTSPNGRPVRLGDDVPVPAGHVGGGLLDRPHAGAAAARFAGSPRSNCRNDGLACAQRLAFITLDKIAITPPEPAGAAAAASSITTYGSTPRAAGLRDLGVAERVPEPAHAHPAVEADALEHPLARHHVAQRPQPDLRVDERLGEQHRVLPERPGHHGVLVPLRARAEQAELGVAAARGHRRARPQPGQLGRRRADLAHHRARVGHRRQSRRGQAAQRRDGLRPAPAGQREHARAGPAGGFGHVLAGQPVHDPVAEHAQAGGRGQDVRAGAWPASAAGPGR